MTDDQLFAANFSKKRPIFEVPSVGVDMQTPVRLPSDDNILARLGQTAPPPINPTRAINMAPQEAQIQQPNLSAPINQIQPPEQTDSMFSTSTDPVFTPDTRAQDRFYKLLDEMPQRPDPGLHRRIVAGISRLGPDPNASERIMYGGYQRQMADFDRRASLLKDLAANERSGNVNERNAVNNILMQRSRDRVAEQRDRAQDERDRQNQRMFEIAEFRRLHPDYQFKVVEDGQYVAFNPKDPSAPAIPTGWKSGEMNDMTRALMSATAQGALIGLRGEQEERMEAIRQQNRIDLANARAQLQSDKARADAGQMSPQELRVYRYNVANYLLDTDEDAKRFITITGANDFNIRMRNSYFPATQADNQAKFEHYNETVYGPNWRNDPAAVNGQGVAPSNTPVQTPNKPTAIRVPNVPPSSSPTRAGMIGARAQAQAPTQIRRRYDKELDQTEESKDGGRTWQVIGKGRIQ